MTEYSRIPGEISINALRTFFLTKINKENKHEY